MGLCSGFRTRNESEVLLNVQINRGQITGTKGVCPKELKVRED